MEATITGVRPRDAAGNTQPAMRNLVSMEALKLRKRLMTKIVFGIITAGMALFMSIGYLTTRSANHATAAERQDQLNGFLFPEVFENVSTVIGGLGSVLLVMLAASMIGSEYGWGTVRVLVSSGISRTRLLTAKLIALAEATALFVVAGFATGSVTSAALAIAGGHDLSVAWVDGAALGDLALMFVRLTFLLLIPATIAFTVSIVSRSLAVGIAVGIGYQITEQILSAVLGSIGSVGERLQDLLVSTNMAAIDQYNVIGSPSLDPGLPGAWQAAAILTLYCAILLAISLVTFRRRDIASGS